MRLETETGGQEVTAYTVRPLIWKRLWRHSKTKIFRNSGKLCLWRQQCVTYTQSKCDVHRERKQKLPLKMIKKIKQRT